MTTSILRGERFWAMVPVALLSGLVLTVLGFVHVALDDPGFAVEDHYYRRALSWDERVAAERRSRALGWSAELSAGRAEGGAVTLSLVLRDRDGRPVNLAHVDASGFAVARSRASILSTFTEHAEGHYEAELATRRGGLWELSLDATKGTERFTKTVRVEIPEESRR